MIMKHLRKAERPCDKMMQIMSGSIELRDESVDEMRYNNLMFLVDLVT